eukprot:TRINITY_DN19623_c0_g1_i1.p1 TRINITY_DN19623_c0_g1~~TRINITY_DN19623_c0_g1_i1.p1  ORF type:complete len:439 (-),score=62.10 TRINITY_DN19623_c0_g1_i1:19-1281(-)
MPAPLTPRGVFNSAPLTPGLGGAPGTPGMPVPLTPGAEFSSVPLTPGLCNAPGTPGMPPVPLTPFGPTPLTPGLGGAPGTPCLPFNMPLTPEAGFSAAPLTPGMVVPSTPPLALGSTGVQDEVSSGSFDSHRSGRSRSRPNRRTQHSSSGAASAGASNWSTNGSGWANSQSDHRFGWGRASASNSGWQDNAWRHDSGSSSSWQNTHWGGATASNSNWNDSDWGRVSGSSSSWQDTSWGDSDWGQASGSSSSWRGSDFNRDSRSRSSWQDSDWDSHERTWGDTWNWSEASNTSGQVAPAVATFTEDQADDDLRATLSKSIKDVEEKVARLRELGILEATARAALEACGNDADRAAEWAMEQATDKPTAADVNANPLVGDCVICMEEAAEYAVVPCGHQCLCKNCKQTSPPHCPVCRGTVII